MSRTYDPDVAPLLLAAAGVVALGIAAVILRSFGSRYRVGRLLAAAPKVSIAEALRLAGAGDERYVRVDGRIDSDAEFEDADHRPLVLRRTSIQWRAPGSGGPWTTVEAATEAVEFVVREGLDDIVVEGSDLAEGLIVVPRVSRGRAADLGERAPEGVAADAEAQVVVEQVSSVEHATVAGVPRRLADGRVAIGPGLGRPLLLTTLERDEAMRVLSGGAPGRSRAAIACLAGGAVLLGLAAAWWLVEAVGGGAAVALAASPDPSLRPGADTRSSGQGPGLVGEPLLAIVGMLGIAAASVIASLAYVRLTSGRQGAADDEGRARRP
jgi:hypothetical protein